MAQAFRRIFTVHPELVHLLPNERMLGPNAMRGREAASRGLMDWGFTPEAAIAIYVGIVTWVLGQTIVDRFVDGAGERRPAPPGLRGARLGRVPDRPREATTSPERWQRRACSSAGLAALLDGLEARFPLGPPAR